MQDHPLAVVALILLGGIHAAVWCVVFDRLGYPPVWAAWLLLPPLAFFMPLVLVLAQWPGQESSRFTRRFRRAPTPQVRRFVRRARPAGPVPQGFFDGRRPVILGTDGLPRVRISLEQSHEDTLFRPRSDAPKLQNPDPWAR